ncbi:MAG: TetR/AcrR family transcriptional regulator [Cypionkella sp.]|nr:TetR/AcrR family transcriptional regulator [Cypionkella sp.]
MSLRKPADQRKSEIVATMLRLADELGPDRLTTQTVAATVGLTQPAIFRHFPTKQDLWLAVAEMIEDRLTSAWDQALSASSDPLVRIRALVQGQLQQIEAMPAIPAILFSRELQVENEDLRHAVRRLMTNLMALLTSEIVAGQNAGVITPTLPAKEGALLLISLVQGLAIRWTLGKRDFSLLEEGRTLLDTQLRLFSHAQPKATP